MYYIVYTNFLASGRKQGYVHGRVFVGACVENRKYPSVFLAKKTYVLALTLKL